MYCILNMGWTPSQYINLSQKERAFVTASILIKVEEEKKQAAEMKRKADQAKSRGHVRRR